MRLGFRKPIRSPKGDEWRSCTVSYRSETAPLVTSRVGYGKTFRDALLDADSQMPDGLWRRIVVSHVQSVYTDVTGDRISRAGRNHLKYGENVVVRIERRISEVVDG